LRAHDVLVNAYGQPFTKAGFGNRFRDWCDSAALPHCDAHKLCKAGALIAAENGATKKQLMAIFGWGDDAAGRPLHEGLRTSKNSPIRGCACSSESETFVNVCVPIRLGGWPILCPNRCFAVSINDLTLGWYSLGELNPCFQIENLMS
jgi:hypothetical protein